MQPIETSVFDDIKMPLTPVSKGKRFANYIIDIAVYYLVFVIIIMSISFILALTGGTFIEFIEEETTLSKLATQCIGLAVFILYYTVVEGISKGRSLGKLITGTVAIQEDGEPIGWKHAFKRTLYRCIPFEQVSIFTSPMMVHDRGPKTIVVNVRQIS